MFNRPPTIGEYLIRKLESYDIEHIFGIPGRPMYCGSMTS